MSRMLSQKFGIESLMSELMCVAVLIMLLCWVALMTSSGIEMMIVMSSVEKVSSVVVGRRRRILSRMGVSLCIEMLRLSCNSILN